MDYYITHYREHFFTFENPLFLALSVMILSVVTVMLVFMKIIIPLQKRFYIEKQKSLLEKVELMARFSELDPDPLIRINDEGIIINTNSACRQIFPGIENKRENINRIIPNIKEHTNYGEIPSIIQINSKYFAVLARRDEKANFTNIYLHDITQIKIYENDLENYKNRLKSLAKKLDSENEEIKKTLAAELHDDIGQQLISLKYKAMHLENCNLNEFESEVENIYKKVRSLSHKLRPIDLSRQGLELSLRSLVHKISNDAKIAGTFDFYGSREGIKSEIEFCIYRTTQEAITNIIKHAKATEFSVLVHNADNEITVNITDNGVGIPQYSIDSEQFWNNGTGLFSMKERIENLGGTLKINSIHCEGTTLFIQIPKG